jgi:hypothetical protein
MYGIAKAIAYLGMCMVASMLYMGFVWACYTIIDEIKKRIP